MKKKYVLLAVDIPKLNEQSMKAVEQIIAALHGVHFGPNKKEQYWLGVVQDKFSLEIVSIDGYIQYFIHCDDYNVELAKGAIFAQYPDAEIVEVEDYVLNVPQNYPDDSFDIWGTEFVLAKKDYYPIKTYEFFEHSLTGIFADPMAAILELLSRLKPGEQIWLQFIITPEGYEWREGAMKEVDDLIGKKTPWKKTMVDYATDLPQQALGAVHDAVFTYPDGLRPEEGLTREEENGSFMGMTTGERVIVEEVQKKASRLLFQTKFRFIYFAPKEIMNSYRAVGSVFGAIKQFNTLDLNAFKGGGKTITSNPTYFAVQRRRNTRKNKIMMGYKYRSNWSGEASYALSNVELATVFHFPSENVRAPLVSKTDSKKAEPPSALPIEPSPFDTLRTSRVKSLIDTSDAVPAELPGAEIPVELPLEKQGVVPAVPTYIAPPAPATTADMRPVASAPKLEQQAGSSIHDGKGYPLHSMPGLPPGVQAVKNPTPADSGVAHQTQSQHTEQLPASQEVRQHAMYQQAHEPAAQPQPKSETPFAEQVVRQPAPVARLAQAPTAAPAQQAAPVNKPARPTKSSKPGTRGSAPPNLPI